MNAYVTHGHATGSAKSIAWLGDWRTLHPHAGWRSRTCAEMIETGVGAADGDAGPLWLNAERGTVEAQADAMQRLRAIFPDRAIGFFSQASVSVYREAAWNPSKLGEATKRWRERFDRLMPLADYASVYGYRLTPDRGQHSSAVATSVELARSIYGKPVYVVDWPHVHPGAKQFKERAGTDLTAEEWAWHRDNVWPLADGAIVFCPDGWPTKEHAEIME